MSSLSDDDEVSHVITIQEIIEKIRLNSNTKRKKANKKLRDANLYICLHCLHNFHQYSDLKSHLSAKRNRVNGKRITKQYKDANEEHQSNSNEITGQKRLEALVRVICLVVTGPGVGS